MAVETNIKQEMCILINWEKFTMPWFIVY